MIDWRAAVDASEAIVVVLDADGRVRDWSRAAQALLDDRAAPARGRALADLLPTSERARVAEALRTLAGGSATAAQASFDASLPEREGSRSLRWTLRKLAPTDGAAALVVASAVDRTEAARAEQAARAVRARWIEAEKRGSVADLVAGIAHDVGTPMTAILGYAELLAKSATDDKNRKRAVTIVEQVHRVSDLLETLLGLARPAGHPARPLALAEPLDKALDLYREKLARHGIEVVRDYRAAPHVNADAARLHQVLSTLILGAVEAMPSGGRLRVAVAESRDGAAIVRFAHPRAEAASAQTPPVAREPGAAAAAGAARTSGLVVARALAEELGGELAQSEAAGDAHLELRLPPSAEPRP